MWEVEIQYNSNRDAVSCLNSQESIAAPDPVLSRGSPPRRKEVPTKKIRNLLIKKTSSNPSTSPVLLLVG